MSRRGSRPHHHNRPSRRVALPTRLQASEHPTPPPARRSAPYWTPTTEMLVQPRNPRHHAGDDGTWDALLIAVCVLAAVLIALGARQ